MICSSAFWKQKCENLKNISLTFQVSIHTGLLCLWPEALIDSFINCTGVIIYNKLDNYFFVSADRQKFLGFEMTANLRDTSPLILFVAVIKNRLKSPHVECFPVKTWRLRWSSLVA